MQNMYLCKLEFEEKYGTKLVLFDRQKAIEACKYIATNFGQVANLEIVRKVVPVGSVSVDGEYSHQGHDERIEYHVVTEEMEVYALEQSKIQDLRILQDQLNSYKEMLEKNIFEGFITASFCQEQVVDIEKKLDCYK